MPAPKKEVLQQFLSAIQDSQLVFKKDFFNIARGFAVQPSPGQFLLQASTIHKKLAETLLVFRKKLREAAAGDTAPESAIDQAFLHYVVNTDGQIPESKGDDPFDALEAASRYAESLSVDVIQREDEVFLEVDGKQAHCPEWVLPPDKSAAWSLRKLGGLINRVRYGRDDIIPSSPFGFDENADGHTLQNALALADFSHLAYFSAAYVERHLQRCGYGAFRWVEDKKTDTQAFIAGKDNHLIICFRGTSSGKDALVDARFLKTRAPGRAGRVHSGFNRALDKVWGQLQATVEELGSDKKLFLSGHSLGAALAQLAAHRLALGAYSVAGVYVYGSPRVGNPKFRDAYNELLEKQTFLYINNKDIVTRIPPRILGFRHLGGGPRQFDEEHSISELPKPKSIFEEEEKDYDELDEATQQAIMQEIQEAQQAMEASTRFLNMPPDLLEDVNSKGIFDIRPVDDHSMDQYLYKFGYAIVDGEWQRLEESD